MLGVGYRPSRTFTLDENNPEFTYNLPSNVHMLSLLMRIAGELSIATGGEDAVRSESVLRLLPRLGVSSPLGVHYPDNWQARWAFAWTRRLSSQDPTLSEPADATAQSNTSFEAEFELTFSPEFLAHGPPDMHIPPISPEEVFQLVGEWETLATNASSDAGTGALIEDSDGSDVAVTFDTTPFVEITPIYAHTMPQPFAVPRFTVATGDVFTAADTEYPVPIRTKLDIAAMILRAFDNGSEEDLVDAIDRVTVGERHDFTRVLREALSYRERKSFPSVAGADEGELGVLFADNGKLGTRLLPVQDLQRDELTLEVTAPGTGDHRVEATFLHAVRMAEAQVTRRSLARGGGGRGRGRGNG